MAAEADCSRCKGQGHRAACCPNFSFLRTCELCQQVGHTRKTCPVPRTCAYCKLDGHTIQNCPKKLERRERRARQLAWDDSKSETSQASNGPSVSTASTAAVSEENQKWSKEWSKEWSKDWWNQRSSWSKKWKPQKPAFTEDEEKELKKMEKKLREIAALEDRLAAGEVLDKLQKEKVENKFKIEECDVMRKLRKGYRRFEPAKSQQEAK